MKSPSEWFNEIKQNEKIEIRLSDIDNLLQESIFETTNGDKLVEYIKKKRGGGRARLHDIFERAAGTVQRPNFNFDMDTSDPHPLPPSPEEDDGYAPSEDSPGQVEIPTSDDAAAHNGNGLIEATSSPAKPNPPVVLPTKASLNMVTKSPAPTTSLSRQVLINQYQRTNAAKCEMLRQLATSTPKPDESSTSNRVSNFTMSISPILENSPSEELPKALSAVLVHSEEPAQPSQSKEAEPVTEQILVPSSQPVPAPENNSRKVIVIRTQTDPPPPSQEVIVPETPSPIKESPKVANHTHIQPRRLCDTFEEIGKAASGRIDEHLTSDEDDDNRASTSGDENIRLHVSHIPTPKESMDNSSLLKSILKDRNSSQNRRSAFRVSFSQQLVQEREISPAPSIPTEYSNSDSGSDDSSNESECDEGEFEVIDEVYSDDNDEEYGPDERKQDYEEYKQIQSELEKHLNNRSIARPESPLIDVVEEQPVQWYETRTPRHDDVHRGKSLVPPTTGKKDNKTNLQLVDIITDWDDEEEDEVESEAAVDSVEIPETQQTATQRTNETNRDPMDISSSNMEQSIDRIVELLPPPPGFGEIESETADTVSLTTPSDSPPSQLTESAKHRFLRENEDALISRIQNELPASQPPTSGSPSKSYEKVSETLVEIAQSFRDQPPPPVAPQELKRNTLIPPKKRKAAAPDPAKTSYFETVAKTFAKPTMPPPATATKRKLYVPKISDEETSPVVGRKPCEITPTIRNFNIVIRKLRLEDHLEKVTEDSSKKQTERDNDIDEMNHVQKKKPGKYKKQDNPSVTSSRSAIRQPKEQDNGPAAAESADTNEKARKVPSYESDHEYSLHQKDCSDTNSQSSESHESSDHQPLRNQSEEALTNSNEEDTRNDSSQSDESNSTQYELVVAPVEKKTMKRQRKKKGYSSTDSDPSSDQPLGNQRDAALTDSNEQDIPNENPNSDESNSTQYEPMVPPVEKKTMKKRKKKGSSSIDTDRSSDQASRENNTSEALVESSALSMESTDSGIQNVRISKISLGKTSMRSKNDQDGFSTGDSLASTDVTDATCDDLQPGGRDVEAQTKKAVKKKPTARKKKGKQKVNRAAKNVVRKEAEETEDKLISKSKVGTKRKRIIETNGSMEKDSPQGVVPTKQKKKGPAKRYKKPAIIEDDLRDNIETNVSLPKNKSTEQIVTETPSSDILETSDIVLEDDQFTASRSLRNKKTQLNESPVEPSVSLPDEVEEREQVLPMQSTAPMERDKKRVAQKKKDHFEKYTTEETEKSKVLPRYLREIEDPAWKPSKTLKERVNVLRRELNSGKNNSEEEEIVRRSGRTCRIAKHILMTNPLVKSAFDRPNYRPPTIEEILEAERLAVELRKKELGEHRNTRKPAAKVNPKSTEGAEDENSKQTGSRKRVQHLTLEEEGNIASKRNRLEEASTSTSGLTVNFGTSNDGSRNASDDQLMTSSERLVHEKLQTQSWMMKLIEETNQQADRLPVNPMSSNHVHFTLDHISFQERNGIQYSFFVYSEKENYGFLRFSPLAVKKLTKTADFQLKFLILNGKLNFQINGKEIFTKGGDFLMLPENSKYSIKNCEEVSLIFMVKYLSS